MLNVDEIFRSDDPEAVAEASPPPAPPAEQAQGSEADDRDQTVFTFGTERWIWIEEMPLEFQFPDERPSKYRGLIGCGFPPRITPEPPAEILARPTTARRREETP